MDAALPSAPDEGTGALPLLRGIILNDDKSSTYKLALLRVADGTPSLAAECADTDAVDPPLGLVALNWVRMFSPLVSVLGRDPTPVICMSEAT